MFCVYIFNWFLHFAVESGWDERVLQVFFPSGVKWRFKGWVRDSIFSLDKLISSAICLDNRLCERRRERADGLHLPSLRPSTLATLDRRLLLSHLQGHPPPGHLRRQSPRPSAQRSPCSGKGWGSPLQSVNAVSSRGSASTVARTATL